jgi:hypothetical protein
MEKELSAGDNFIVQQIKDGILKSISMRIFLFLFIAIKYIQLTNNLDYMVV